MSLPSLLRSWKARHARRTVSARRTLGRRAAFRPGMELLEDRVQPSTVTWINPAGGDWDTASNWSSGTVPGPADDAVIDMVANNFTVTHSTAVADSVNSMTCDDALAISNGTILVASSSILNSSLTISGGSLGGTGNLAVGGQFTWLGGTLSGSAGSGLVANGGLVFNPGGTHADILDGRSLTNNGAAVVTGNNSGIDLAHGAAFNNGSPTNPQATFSIQVTGGGAAIYPDDVDSGGVFNNYGTFLSSTLTLRMAVPFNNSGTVEVQSGSIDLGAGGQSSGSFTGDLGTSLTFGGAHVFGPTTSVGGDSIDFETNVSLETPYNANNTTVGGVVSFQGPASPGALWVYGRADFSPASGPVTLILPYLAIESLGTLTGTDNFAVTGEFDWLAGTLSGSAGSSLVANGGLVFNPGGTHADILDGRSLTNNGAAVVTGNNSGIDLAHGAAFNNGSPTNPQATFSIQVTGGARPSTPMTSTQGACSITTEPSCRARLRYGWRCRSITAAPSKCRAGPLTWVRVGKAADPLPATWAPR